MNLDLCTDLLMRGILRQVDPQAKGAFIEIGLGSLNYSFTWAAPAGFHCHAIEPLPTDTLLNASQNLNVPVTVAAIAERRGQATMYFGNLEGRGYPDVSSLNPRWWGSGKQERTVPTLSLADFLDDKHIDALSCLKVDIEGCELVVLQTIPELPVPRQPKLVVFEYGGGCSKKEGRQGWSQEFFSNTLACLKILQAAGYTRGFFIEAILPAPELIELKRGGDFEQIFPDGALAGNFLFWRDPLPEKFLAGLARKTTGQLVRQSRRDRLTGFAQRLVNGLRRRLRKS